MTASSPIVFVTQDPTDKNLTPAREYGDLQLLWPSGDPNFYEEAARIVEQRLISLGFCDSDYLLLLGDPVLIGITVATACKINGGRCKVLKYQKQDRRYTHHQLEI